MSMNIKALIFDCGGVMTADPIDKDLDVFLMQFLEPGEDIKKAKLDAYRSGKTSVEFWREYAAQRGKELPIDWQKKLIALMEDSIQPRREMYDLVKSLKNKGYKVAMLSNVTPLYVEILAARKIYRTFEKSCGCVLSCEIGYDKPAPEAYTPMLAKMAQFAPNEIAFIDDMQANVAAAEEFKMHGITFKDVSQLKTELGKLGIKV